MVVIPRCTQGRGRPFQAGIAATEDGKGQMATGKAPMCRGRLCRGSHLTAGKLEAELSEHPKLFLTALMKTKSFSRRSFIQQGLGVGRRPAGIHLTRAGLLAAETAGGATQTLSPAARSAAKVAIVPCRTYGPEVRPALEKCFDLLGGIGSLVKNKTVTVKLNLTGSDFKPVLGRPVGETYMTHYTTALALGSLLFAAGARRVRFVESTQKQDVLETTLTEARLGCAGAGALGKVEFENTRNLGLGKKYSHLRVPGGGYMFSAFDLNHAYEDTDVLVSLAKLKNHVTAGVTLSMKNLFGLPPNSLYGTEAGKETADGPPRPDARSQGFREREAARH